MRNSIQRFVSIVVAGTLTLATVWTEPALALGEACPLPFTRYTAPANFNPENITEGGDGALWFHGFNRLGRITTNGIMTEIGTQQGRIGDIAKGPSNSTWFTGNNNNSTAYVASVTASGVTQSLPLPNTVWRAGALITGPDGALWVAGMTQNGPELLRVSSSGAITEHSVSIENYPNIPNGSIQSMTIGPDNAIWMLFYSSNSSVSDRIGKFDVQTGVTTWHSLNMTTTDGSLVDIAAGSDGALWFTGYREGGFLGRMTTSGEVTLNREGLLTGGLTFGIASDNNGHLWFSNDASIGRATLNPYKVDLFGIATNLPTPTARGMTIGSDNAVWFTEQSTNSVSKLPVNNIPSVETPKNFRHSSDDIYAPNFSWDGVSGATNYKVCRDGVVAAETNSTTFNDDATLSGEHYYTVVATDGSGNVSAPAFGTAVYVDRQLPVLTEPFIVSEPLLEGQYTELKASASDDIGIQSIQYKIENGEWQYMTAPGGMGGDPDHWQTLLRWVDPSTGINISNNFPGPGIYTISLKAVDVNWRESPIKTIQLTVGIQAPTNLHAPALTNSTPQLTWTGSEGAVSYNIYRDSSPEPVATSTTPSYTDAATLADGNHIYTVSAVATDSSESTQTTPVTVKVDKTAPVISNLTVSPGLVFIAGNLTISATASDALSGITRAEYFIDTDPGQGNATAMTVNTNGTVSATKNIGFNSLTRGTHSVKVRVKDNAGNWSTLLSRNFTYI